MKDQAERLRRIISDKRYDSGHSTLGKRVITITSGKGGVGKTSFSINLAITLKQMGYETLVIDGDFGLSNVDLMLGTIAKYNLEQVIHGEMSIEDILIEGPHGIKFISGGSGIGSLVNLGDKELKDFLKKIEDLNHIADIILIDTGAGATDNIIKMILAAQEVIVLATPEPTAITDAYSLIKLVSTLDKNKNMGLIVNKADTSIEALNILNNFTKATERFLGVRVKKLGFLYEDPRVSKSIKEQVPYVISYPRSRISKQVGTLAKELRDQKIKPRGSESDILSYFKRFLDIIG